MFHRTLACLPALTGAWAARGGGIAKSVGSYTESQIDEDALFRPDLERATPRTLNMSRLGEILTTPHAGETDGPGVHAFINWNCNPLVTVPNAEVIRAGLERDDLFTVVHEQFLTDTARYADIVLPATTQIEADDIVFSWGSLWISYNAAAITASGRGVLEHRAVPPPRRRDGLHRIVAVRRRRHDHARRRSPRSTSTSCARVGWLRRRTPTTVDRSATATFDTAIGSGPPRVRRARSDRPTAGADLRATARGSGRRRRSARRATRCSCSPRSTTPGS